MTHRTVCWFSAGAASAVATLLTLRDTPDAEIVRIDTGSEHPDNGRFWQECWSWYRAETGRTPRFQLIRSELYADTWDVWERTRYLVGPTGARCTAELKKRPRMAFERPDDVQVFGYTAEELARATRFRQQNPEITLATPLIEAGLSKSDCLAMVDRAGIELPVMYRLGFQNNNCVGCPKGGIAYWNHIRRHFPETFDRMAVLERELGVSCLREDSRRGDGGPIWLDALDPDRGGRMADEPDFECSLMCHAASG